MQSIRLVDALRDRAEPPLPRASELAYFIGQVLAIADRSDRVPSLLEVGGQIDGHTCVAWLAAKYNVDWSPITASIPGIEAIMFDRYQVGRVNRYYGIENNGLLMLAAFANSVASRGD